jgi:sialate O-acetylesterase
MKHLSGGALKLNFAHTDGGLQCRTGIPPADSSDGEPATQQSRTSQPAIPGEFSIAGADHKWHWATAKIEGNSVIVSSPDVPDPVAARYAWESFPKATLYNGAGLPAVPFRTDDWPETTQGK